MHTPCARVQVLGRAFGVAAGKDGAGSDRTDVSVDEGSVRLTSTSDGESVEVVQGEFAIAQENRELVVLDMPRPPDEWLVDFEDGIPAGWGHGNFESTGLLSESLGAIRAAREENAAGVFYQIRSAKRWQEGIFAIHPDTHLNVIFKLERPDWFQVFISTRPFDPDLPKTSLYRFKNDRLWQWKNHGRWLHAAIPLKEFERVPERRGTPPLGEVPFELLFSAKGNDRGMVVDKIWISRGGPGELVIEEVSK